MDQTATLSQDSVGLWPSWERGRTARGLVVTLKGLPKT